MKIKTFLKSLLSLSLALIILVSPCLPVRADGENTVKIDSAADLKAMAKDCRLDTHSLGKTYVLSCDITLDGDFVLQIPIFRGTFEGNGHSIDGFTVNDNMAPAGLFGIIESEGVVRNLKLLGNVNPKGESLSTGGLCGINRGLIDNCAYTGSVSGKTEVGGIAGTNDSTGSIKSCSASGKVTGQKMTGGIAGSNHGLIDNAKNICLVNLDSSDPTINIENIETDILSSVTNIREAESIYSSIEDTGGITGFSDGAVTNCTNIGDVGYSHIGYNIGGVVGRNQGFIYGCENQGVINGRREVGGIAGQAEPFISTTPSSENLGNIRNELHNLRNLVDKATRDIDGTSQTVSSRLTSINGIISSASDDAKNLSDAMVDFIDENLDEINRGSDIAKSVSDRLSSITGKLPSISESITSALDTLSDGIRELETSGLDFDLAMDKFTLAQDELDAALKVLDEGSRYISDGANKISSSITVKTPDENNPLSKESVSIDWDAMREGTDLISRGLSILSNGSEVGGNGVYYYVTNAFTYVNDGISYLRDAVDDINYGLSFFRECADTLSLASEDITTVLEEVSSLSDFLSNTDPLEFSHLKSRTELYSNSFHGNLTNLNRELEALNLEIRGSSEVLMADLRAINDQFFLVMDLLVDEISDLKNISLKGRYKDISQEDIDNSTDGKVQFCTNHGAVYGDINVGGIAGSMGIFNPQNPEGGNGSIDETIRARYTLKAILQGCTNYGDIHAKKSCLGAICGLSSLGIITDCNGYGSAISQDGDYVGGISGENMSVIRNSYAKCSLSGKKYLGGITGYNSSKNLGSGSVTGCVTAVNIQDHEQYAGAICGYDDGILSDNYFFGDYAGINNASYSGKAEPLGFDEFVALENLPLEFKRFKVTFVAGEKTVKETYLNYLDSLDSKDFPEIPSKKGKYGKWDMGSIEDIDFDKTITAQYFPYVTAIASTEEKESDTSLFLALGQFDDEEKLLVEPAKKEDSEINLVPTDPFSYVTPRETYVITANDLEGDDVLLRFYRDDVKADSLRFYVKKNGGFVPAPAREVGAYMEFSVPSGTNSIVVAKFINFRLYLVIAGIILIIAALILFITKRKKAKKTG